MVFYEVLRWFVGLLYSFADQLLAQSVFLDNEKEHE